MDQLFPFRFEMELGDRSTIVSAGPGLVEWLSGHELIGSAADELFAAVRPRDLALDLDGVRSVDGKTVFLTHLSTKRSLRGQFVLRSDNRVLFAGSPHVTSDDQLSDLGLTLSAFTPHDAAVDVIVMAAVSSMRVADIERQHASLQAMTEARHEADRSASTDALTDALTGLANRRALWTEWDAIVSRGEVSHHGLLYIDVDRFKQVNDEHGHQIGDQVLQELARRMKRNVKATDLVARLGGDEFAIMLRDLKPWQVEQVAQRLVNRLAAPVQTADGPIDISVSIGVVLRRGPGSLDDALRDADIAMYHGRTIARGDATMYRESMGQEREARRTLTTDLKNAIAGDVGIRPVFQPVVELPTGRITGFEALARWDHPDHGLLGPERFIGPAERAGIIEDVDRLILAESLRTLAGWQDEHPELTMHANVSARSVKPGLVDWLAAQLEATSVLPDRLVIELTESWFVAGDDCDALHELANLGVRLQLDDFGTGFASLTSLHSMPLSGVKIDRSFVTGMAESERDARLVHATIGLAKSLDLEVVAEGVETQEVVDLLANYGCERAQGYFFSRPVDAEQATSLLRENASSSVRS